MNDYNYANIDGIIDDIYRLSNTQRHLWELLKDLVEPGDYEEICNEYAANQQI